jgi:hypothetical protein
VEQTQKETRGNTTLRLGETVGQAQKESFDNLRAILADPLFLVPAHANAKKRLCADANKYGLGAALLQ